MNLAISLICSITILGSPSAQLKSAALGRAGWEALQSGEIEKAAAAFEEAIASNPREATLFLGAGIAAHLRGRDDAARDALQRALEINRRLRPAAALLGAIVHEQGNLDLAIRTYEEALSAGPGDAEMAARLEAWRKEAAVQSNFQQRFGDHFTVLFKGPAEQALATRATQVLEAAYWRIGGALGEYPTQTITVVLYTQQQFRDVTRSPEWAAGAFDGSIRVPMRGALQNPQELERVLAHELTHAIVRSLAPRGVPTWLNEGLAAVFEPVDIASEERLIRRAAVVVPLEKLQGNFGALSDREAALAYAESAIAARMLLDRAGNALPLLLQDLGGGQPFSEVFARHTLMSVTDFQTALERRIKATSDR